VSTPPPGRGGGFVFRAPPPRGGGGAPPTGPGPARGGAGPRFHDYGIDADWCLVALDEHPEDTITAALTRTDYACVVIGGGIRGHEPLLLFFENVINLVRRHAPQAAIAFNTTPEDCADAARRWVG
ncbi:hypothetical protein, partial [Nocardia farcinica]|uniref:hypothetical protein n=1 Tax=Nocardia farcinica TaxID=37329 RepID=UPI00245437DE